MNVRVRHVVTDIPTIVVAVSPTPEAQLNAVRCAILRANARLREPITARSLPHRVALHHELETVAGSLAATEARVYHIAYVAAEADRPLADAIEMGDLAATRLALMGRTIDDSRESLAQGQLALIHLRRAMYYLRRALAEARKSERSHLN